MNRFSSRTPGDFAPNRLNRALAALRASGAPIIDLTVSNPTRVGLPYPEHELLAALSDPRSLRYEPSAQGLAEAREAVAAWHGVEPSHLLLAGSTSEAYGWLFKLLCEPGDSVLTPRPSYPLFECLATLDGVHVRQYALVEEFAWGLDISAIERSLSERTRAIILVNPNNPTGTYLKHDEWLQLQQFAAIRGLAIIVDEVFFDYAWRDDPRRISSFQGPHLALTFSLSGLSKIAGLPQMKLGWVHVSGPAALRDEALARLEWIADSYLPVSAPVQHAAARWFDCTPQIQARIMARTRRNLAALESAVGADSSWRVRPGEGGWSALIEAPRIRSEEDYVLSALEQQHVLFQPGFFYDFEREAFLVASLLPEPAQFDEALRRMAALIRQV